MTEPDIRKLHMLLKNNKVIYKLYNKNYDVAINSDNSVFILSNVGGCCILNLETVPVEDFYVTIPLNQVKQGLQP